MSVIMGMFKLQALGRKLTYQPATDAQVGDFGYGINLTGTYHPWACLCETPRQRAIVRPPCRKAGSWHKSQPAEESTVTSRM